MWGCSEPSEMSVLGLNNPISEDLSDCDEKATSSLSVDAGKQMSWELMITKHRMCTYGLSTPELEKGVGEVVTPSSPDGNSCLPPPLTPSPQRQPQQPAATSPPPSVLLKSPITRSRRLIDKIVQMYDEPDQGSPSHPSPRKKRQQQRTGTGTGTSSSSSRGDRAQARGQKGKGQMGGEGEKVPKVARLHDWAGSALLLADEDEVAAGVEALLLLLEQHDARAAKTGGEAGRALARGGAGGREEVLQRLARELYPPALRLLQLLHRDLRCPAAHHQAFLAAHCHPSAFNFAVILSRIFSLFDSRMILLDALRVAAGKPSQRPGLARSRALQVRTAAATVADDQTPPPLSSRSSTTAAEHGASLLSCRPVNLSGQSPRQIRDWARATAVAQGARGDAAGSSEPEGAPPRLSRGGSFLRSARDSGVMSATAAASDLRRSSSKRRSSLMRSLADIQTEETSLVPPPPPSPPAPTPLRPSEMITMRGRSGGQPDHLNIIVESDDENDDDGISVQPDGDLSDERATRETGAPPPLTTSAPILLQGLCDEWFQSVPWEVDQFKFGERVILRTLAST